MQHFIPLFFGIPTINLFFQCHDPCRPFYLLTFPSAFFSLARLLLSLTMEVHPSSATYMNTAWATKVAKIRRPRVLANANSADAPRACPLFVFAGLGAVEETVMGVVIDATTDEILVMLLEDAWKIDDEAAGTMLDTDVLGEGEMEVSIASAAEVGNAEACACQDSFSACNRDHLAIPAQFSKRVSLSRYHGLSATKHWKSCELTGHSLHRSTLLSVAGIWKQVMLPSYSHTEAADNNEV
jgi:hypothetical protein